MSIVSKNVLKSRLVNGHKLVGSDFTDLLDSLKEVQSSVADPTANGKSVTFISNITQNAEGVITPLKKTVNFDNALSGYVTSTMLNNMNYQTNDKQEVTGLSTDGENVEISQSFEHNKGHYPTVRVLDGNGFEVQRGFDGSKKTWNVQHVNTNEVMVVIDAEMNDTQANYTIVFD